MFPKVFKIARSNGKSLLKFNGQIRNNVSLLNADQGKLGTSIYHSTSIALAALTPLAFILSPSPFNLPVDLSLGVLFPLHSHIAINCIISDYVPKALKSVCRVSLLGVTIVTAVGLLKVNIFGPGITEIIKNLWRKPKQL